MSRIRNLAEAWEFAACWYYATRGVLPQADGREYEVDAGGVVRGWSGLCDFIEELRCDDAIGIRVHEQMQDALDEYPVRQRNGWLWYWKRGQVASRVRYCLQQAELARKEGR